MSLGLILASTYIASALIAMAGLYYVFLYTRTKITEFAVLGLTLVGSTSIVIVDFLRIYGSQMLILTSIEISLIHLVLLLELVLFYLLTQDAIHLSPFLFAGFITLIDLIYYLYNPTTFFPITMVAINPYKLVLGVNTIIIILALIKTELVVDNTQLRIAKYLWIALEISLFLEFIVLPLIIRIDSQLVFTIVSIALVFIYFTFTSPASLLFNKSRFLDIRRIYKELETNSKSSNPKLSIREYIQTVSEMMQIEK